jgi:hypothetical protein
LQFSQDQYGLSIEYFLFSDRCASKRTKCKSSLGSARLADRQRSQAAWLVLAEKQGIQTKDNEAPEQGASSLLDWAAEMGGGEGAEERRGAGMGALRIALIAQGLFR